MKNLDIHKASDTEKDSAARLLAASDPWITLHITEEQCRKNCYDQEYQLYIASVNNESAGIILLDPRGVAGSPYIKSIAVYSSFRGKGIGTLLLSFAEDLFRGTANHIFICVSSFNDRARKLYEKCGYRKVGEFKDYIIEGASEILMHKRL